MSLAIITATATFKNSGGLVDPTTVSAEWWDGTNGRTALVATKSSLGVYTATLPCEDAGTYVVEWFGDTGTLHRRLRTSYTVEP